MNGRLISDDLRAAICDWARTNNLNPGDIPVSADITINEQANTITTEVWVRREGKLVVLGNEALRTSVTVPLLTRPPDSIAHRLTFAGRPTA
ncbi:hypothetical protein EYA84_02110 [Verrucosispora sp. SN26_14.1]|uniref:hypothetical protein n=1 Tax=Verrucosispora sp. SN26_14.1 TaxID=2527879 RepID=UPI0010348D49|nr:hypothetical protein [Verrucosispora sp. SN26_14.1]TBL44258.1 hypothetical protein EYA84_02110 [Verrucosispora sp. SN26_14.1]